MSLLGKKWIIKESDPHESLYNRLLKSRGIEGDAAIEKFLYPSVENDFHDPFLMKDMQKAVERIYVAIRNKERIMIFGDYDVDGITGTAILMRVLKTLGAQVSSRLPNRLKDGYGLRTKFIDQFSAIGVKVIITVDNGISCATEVTYAATKGIDVIISDHHTVPAHLPNAVALLHPKLPGCGYPFSELTGAGVALKFAQALVQTAPDFAPDKISVANEELIHDLLDLACLGTVADLGELTGENRFIVKKGLQKLSKTRWPGLSRLKEAAGIKGEITTETVGFIICPRINAAGRMSDPTEALRLLIHEGDGVNTLAENLNLLNRERQDLMKKLIEIAKIEAVQQKNNPVIIVCNELFHGGIIGLIAARIAEQYNRPAVAMEIRGDMLIGSCRSIPGINIVEALTQLEHNAVEEMGEKILGNFGGHAGAAGFDMPGASETKFREQLKLIVGKMMEDHDPYPQLHIDTTLADTELSFESLNIVKLLEPFGMGNAAPLFACTDLQVHDVMTVGRDKSHLKIRVRAAGTIIDAMAFKLGHLYEKLIDARTIDIAGTLDENIWNGNRTLQLKVKDIRVQ